MTEPTIRAGRSGDSEAVAAICRATARAGDPQPRDVPDPELVADVYARPYLALEPRTARLLVRDGRVIGYVVGAVDSGSFAARWRSEWSPAHLPRPTGADPELVRLLADPSRGFPAEVVGHPSHLHVNLLPGARGGGWGQRLLESFLDGCKRAGSAGVHLVVAGDNHAARRFYARVGFCEARERGGDIVMTRDLSPPSDS